MPRDYASEIVRIIQKPGDLNKVLIGLYELSCLMAAHIKKLEDENLRLKERERERRNVFEALEMINKVL